MSMSIFLTLSSVSPLTANGQNTCVKFYFPNLVSKLDLNSATIKVSNSIDINVAFSSPSGQSAIALASDRKSIEILNFKNSRRGSRDYLEGTSSLKRDLSALFLHANSRERSAAPEVKKFFIFQKTINSETRDFVGIEWADQQVQFFEIAREKLYDGRILEQANPVFNGPRPSAVQIEKSKDLEKYFDDFVELGLRLKLPPQLEEPSETQFLLRPMSRAYRNAKSSETIDVHFADGVLNVSAPSGIRDLSIRLQVNNASPKIPNSNVVIDRLPEGNLVAVHGRTNELYIIDLISNNGVSYTKDVFHKDYKYSDQLKWDAKAIVLGTKMFEVESVMRGPNARTFDFIGSIWSDGTFVIYSLDKSPGFSPRVKVVYTETLSPEWIDQEVLKKGAPEVVNELFNTYFRHTAEILDPTRGTEQD